MKFNNEEKTKLVNKVFSEVYQRYDLMNDIMSFGIHRIWKHDMIYWMRPQKNDKIIDVASGTGDLAKICSQRNNNQNQINCVEPNQEMFELGKKKLKNFKNISWHKASAEKLPFSNNIFDYYIISFGIRNVTNIDKTFKEAFRVLKSGGRLFCLEFSKVENEIVQKFYYQYFKIIPKIGKIVVGNDQPYKYLTKSIEKFYNQQELKEFIEKSGFSNVEFRNLSNGIAAIHTGWKL